MTRTIGPMANWLSLDLLGERLDQLGARRAGLADEEPVELARQEGRGLGAFERDPHDVRRPPAPVPAEERLGPVVDLRGLAGEDGRLLETAAGIPAAPSR